MVSMKNVKFFIRGIRFIMSSCLEVFYTLRNALTSQSVLGERDAPVVSLTTYGSRTVRVFLTIESVAAGAVRPSRLILWLDDPEQRASLPKGLQRLQRRGLEILATEDYGPHKKYYPYVRAESDFTVSLVTADDDVYYMSSWLSTLARESKPLEDQVLAMRARRIAVSHGQLEPYGRWPLAAEGEMGANVFPTGVGGVLYPPFMLKRLKAEGDAFLEVCPRADDVWLHAQTLRSGRVARSIGRETLLSQIPVRGAGDGGLWQANVTGAGNDEQIAATYKPSDIARVVAAEDAL